MKFNFRIKHTDGTSESGKCVVSLSIGGQLQVRLIEFRLDEETDPHDFFACADYAHTLLKAKIIRELSNDLESLRYASMIDVFESREEDVLNETEVG